MSAVKMVEWGLRRLAHQFETDAADAHSDSRRIREAGYEGDTEKAYGLGFAEGISAAKRSAASDMAGLAAAMEADDAR